MYQLATKKNKTSTSGKTEEKKQQFSTTKHTYGQDSLFSFSGLTKSVSSAASATQDTLKSRHGKFCLRKKSFSL